MHSNQSGSKEAIQSCRFQMFQKHSIAAQIAASQQVLPSHQSRACAERILVFSSSRRGVSDVSIEFGSQNNFLPVSSTGVREHAARPDSPRRAFGQYRAPLHSRQIRRRKHAKRCSTSTRARRDAGRRGPDRSEFDRTYR
jgi:hypothetical protein